MTRYYKKWFLPLLLPALILFALVIALPFILGIIYSFTGWRGSYFVGEYGRTEVLSEAFVGLANYAKAFASQKFRSAFAYTMEFTLISVVTINITGLLLALMIHSIGRGRGLFRTVFFLPNMLGGLALGYIWQIIFQTVFSEMLFGPGGLIPIEFFTYMTQDRLKNLFALAILMTWQSAGYMMIIYMTGLNGIPGEIYEASSIDGASRWQTFRSVTLPMLMPAVTVCIFLTLANSFKLLDQNVALTDGEFNTRLLALQILRTTRDASPPDYGMAQAQAVIFFIAVAVITLLQVTVTKKREVEM